MRILPRLQPIDTAENAKPSPSPEWLPLAGTSKRRKLCRTQRSCDVTRLP
jgi:hypothetical protein